MKHQEKVAGQENRRRVVVGPGSRGETEGSEEDMGYQQR